MTAPQDLTRALQDWLREPDGLPPPRLGEMGPLVRTTRQQHTILPPIDWGLRPLYGATRYLVAGVIVVVFGSALLVTQTGVRPPAIMPGTTTDEPAPPPVTGPAGNGLIAFSHDGDIYVGDPATGSGEAVVAGPALDTDPKFSPDGAHIAFRRIHAPGDAERHEDSDVIVVRSDGSDERIVVLPDGPGADGVSDFVWSPDGRSLVATDVVGVPGPQMALSLLDPAGSAEARFLTGPLSGPYGFGGDQVAWFLRPPDGDRLLVTDWSAPTILAERDLDGSDVLDLGALAGLEEARRRWAAGAASPRYQGVREGDVAWSPDASRIAFLASFNSHLYPDHLYVMDADGSDLRLLTDDAGRFAWSPDGSTMAMMESARVEPGSTDYCPDEWYIDFCASAEWITLIDVETGTQRDLEATRLPNPGVADPTNDWPAIGDWSWSPDGRSILMMLGEPGTRPLVIDVTADTSTELPWESDSIPSWQRVAAD